jgi:GNAT superfamily N-acetyltransferase
MAIVIRPAEPADAHDIAVAHVAAWRVAYRGIVPDAFLDGDAFADARMAGWHRRLHDGRPEGWDQHDEIFAAVVNDRVVGFGHVGRERTDDGGHGNRGEVYGFYLHPDAWGSGAGRLLMDRCEDSLRPRFPQALLWVLRDSPRARRFYERSGWSCGVGSDVVEAMWEGPQMADIQRLEPLAEIQYRRLL